MAGLFGHKHLHEERACLDSGVSSALGSLFLIWMGMLAVPE